MSRFSIKWIVFLAIVLVMPLFAGAQSITTKFFKDRYLHKEVSPNKAKFSQTVSHESGGRVTTEIKDLMRNEVILSETFKGEEPFGIWIYRDRGKEVILDYEFDLVYSEKKFEENEFSKLLHDFFADNDSLGYKAPVIASGEKSIAPFVFHHMYYPVRAREEGIQGKVQVGFKITGDAKVEDFLVYKGTNIMLDKEAVRVMRKLKVSSPPVVKGEPTSFKLMLPLSFKIQ